MRGGVPTDFALWCLTAGDIESVGPYCKHVLPFRFVFLPFVLHERSGGRDSMRLP